MVKAQRAITATTSWRAPPSAPHPCTRNRGACGALVTPLVKDVMRRKIELRFAHYYSIIKDQLDEVGRHTIEPYTLVPEPLNMKAVIGSCNLIDGCSLVLCSATVSVVWWYQLAYAQRNEVNSIVWLYRRVQPNIVSSTSLLHNWLPDLLDTINFEAAALREYGAKAATKLRRLALCAFII